MPVKSYLHLGASFPIGVRNNNPGNLAKSRASFKGVTTRPNSGRGHLFFAFSTMAYGMLACIQTVQSHVRSGLNTVTKLAYRYAPPAAGNDTPLWIRQVCTYAGIRDPNAPLQTDPASLKALVMAIVKKETGLVHRKGGTEATITGQDYDDALALVAPPPAAVAAALLPDVVINPVQLRRPAQFVPQMVL